MLLLQVAIAAQNKPALHSMVDSGSRLVTEEVTDPRMTKTDRSWKENTTEPLETNQPKSKNRQKSLCRIAVHKGQKGPPSQCHALWSHQRGSQASLHLGPVV